MQVLCSPVDYTARCPGRRHAEDEGLMIWSHVMGGWVHKDFNRTMSGPNRKRAVYYAERDTTGEPYLLEFCPYCYAELPNLNRRIIVAKKKDEDR